MNILFNVVYRFNSHIDSHSYQLDYYKEDIKCTHETYTKYT